MHEPQHAKKSAPAFDSRAHLSLKAELVRRHGGRHCFGGGEEARASTTGIYLYTGRKCMHMYGTGQQRSRFRTRLRRRP